MARIYRLPVYWFPRLDFVDPRWVWANKKIADLQAERNAAIKRGKVACGWLRHHFVRAINEHKRVIAAERDAEAQEEASQC